jgi:uracil-DNA glycosylase family 4
MPRVMLVGEQPGDTEDLRGQPFAGPAGQVLDRALAELGIDRATLYLTNAVKHFHHERRGKVRLHKRPESRHIQACRPWLMGEIARVRPQVIVCLGATAAASVFGRDFDLSRDRGRWHTLEDGTRGYATVHPAWVLRQAMMRAARKPTGCSAMTWPVCCRKGTEGLSRKCTYDFPSVPFSGGVGLVFRARAVEGVQRLAGRFDAAQGRVRRQVQAEAVGVVQLRQQAEVGQAGTVTVAEGAGVAAVGQHRFHRREALGDPVQGPLRAGIGRQLQVRSRYCITRRLLIGWMSQATSWASARTRARPAASAGSSGTCGKRSSRYSRIASDWVSACPSCSRVGTSCCGLSAR